MDWLHWFLLVCIANLLLIVWGQRNCADRERERNFRLMEYIKFLKGNA